MFANKTHSGLLKSSLRKLALVSFAITALAVTIIIPRQEAQATGCCPNNSACTEIQNAISQAMETALHEALRANITQQFVYQQRWFMFDFFRTHILPAMMNMAEQLTTTGEAQVFTFGAILDAKETLETERLIQEKTAQAHRDYIPDVGMCTIGTAAQSLAASDRTGEYTAIALNKRMIDRQMNIQGTSAFQGSSTDVEARIRQFRDRFCDRHSNTGNTTNLCNASAGPFINRDIDYAATVGLRRTLNLNLTNGSAAAPDTDDENIIALASNLYGNRVFERFSVPTDINMTPAEYWQHGQLAWYLDRRSITAKRNVAQNSFNAIVGMKAAGSSPAANAGNYLYAVFSQLGVSDNAEARQMLGANPSYYALLEVIAQKIYQDPEFYTNLYDSPTNVLRKKVAMQAIDLMLDRDTFKSELRTEALLSVLLETEMIGYQKDLEKNLNNMTDQERLVP
ncbi:MAG: hypothetical protein ACK4NR_01635 [Micavibrio sp.]